MKKKVFFSHQSRKQQLFSIRKKRDDVSNKQVVDFHRNYWIVKRKTDRHARK